ncbi:MAG: hypothetical protein Q8K59_04480 [Nitrosomonas sp.]|nr:hypothetical protein [Nitrosomonas sp.]MDP1950346.1 hypothetical protein [Nitrosomonas sp.]
MASTNQIFISFALKDADLRDVLVEQIGKENAELICVDMPMKKSWESAWKAETLEKVRGCDGVIGIISENIARADGQLWELRCAYDSGLPVLLISEKEVEVSAKLLPDLIKDKDIAVWEGPVISMFLNKVK